MQLKDLYTVIVTDRRQECRDFYVRWFDFEVVFEASWFVYLASRGGHAFGIAFMSPDHPSTPPGPERFSGQGVFLTLQVADAQAQYARLAAAGAPIVHALHDEPWGQRRFALQDPAGTFVDVVEQIDPAPGFWDPYLPS
jgi:uncharacterized glyoxalase superfamily protein PhnB